MKRRNFIFNIGALSAVSSLLNSAKKTDNYVYKLKVSQCVATLNDKPKIGSYIENNFKLSDVFSNDFDKISIKRLSLIVDYFNCSFLNSLDIWKSDCNISLIRENYTKQMAVEKIKEIHSFDLIEDDDFIVIYKNENNLITINDIIELEKIILPVLEFVKFPIF